jgi:putative lipoic acid-binding regulatory protein
MTDDYDDHSLLKFPCKFPIKIFGLTENHIESLALSIINKHVSNLSEGSIRTRNSKEGKYTAVTITVYAQNQQQLDMIYQDLSQEDAIIMVL